MTYTTTSPQMTTDELLALPEDGMERDLILSPSDQQEDIMEKVRAYLECGVKIVWIGEPVFRTVVVYRPDAGPMLFKDSQELSGEPHLPGFKAAVAEVFAS